MQTEQRVLEWYDRLRAWCNE